MHRLSISILCCLGFWGYSTCIEQANKIQHENSPAPLEETKTLTAAQEADQKFLKEVFLPGQEKTNFTIENLDHERLAKALLYLGRISRIEKPTLGNPYTIVFVSEKIELDHDTKLNTLYAKSQEGTLLILLDSMVLSLDTVQKTSASGAQ